MALGAYFHLRARACLPAPARACPRRNPHLPARYLLAETLTAAGVWADPGAALGGALAAGFGFRSPRSLAMTGVITRPFYSPCHERSRRP